MINLGSLSTGLVLGLLLFLATPLIGLSATSDAAITGDPTLTPLLNELVRTATSAISTNESGKPNPVRPDQLAITLIDLQDRAHPRQSAYRGEVQIYPASVVKLFYLVAVHRWLEDGRLKDTDELRRAMRRMIVDSWNEATHYVVDLLTDTTSGPELPPAELDEWFQKRNAVNRYFQSLGYRQVVANRKPWCEGPFGREKQSASLHAPYRNLLTTDETARLLTEIATGKTVTQDRSSQMLALLARDPVPKPEDPESQVLGFVGEGLPAGAKLWSKAGWTSETRHDAALVELADGRRFILVVFTTDHANDGRLIPSLARTVVQKLPKR